MKGIFTYGHVVHIASKQLTKSKTYIPTGILLGWSEITRMFEGKMNVIDTVGAQLTDLNKHCVFLDSFKIMNYFFTKKYFSEKTTSEIIGHAAKSMGVKLAIVIDFNSLWHKFMFYCNTLKQAKHDKAPIELQSYIAIIECHISVHKIYRYIDI